ncbi:MAG TPA: hypothetical protein VJR46_06420 [Candidatus Dormibacteraeota bacterium]|nr:hypothetical protein [Candidatus Dormibacteraeota bacterium]
MALSDVQAGRIGEFLVAVYAMLTTSGKLVPFQVDADDDHRDLVIAEKGKSTFASLQAKACFALGDSGFVQSNATYFEDSIPRDPSWIYVIVLVLELAPVVWWVIPAPDFNRLTTHSPARGGREVELHFRAYPGREDAAAPFRVATRDLGPRLLALLDALPPETKPLQGARLVMTRR